MRLLGLLLAGMLAATACSTSVPETTGAGSWSFTDDLGRTVHTVVDTITVGTKTPLTRSASCCREPRFGGEPVGRSLGTRDDSEIPWSGCRKGSSSRVWSPPPLSCSTRCRRRRRSFPTMPGSW